jgi:cell wall-associated NlpC family hydrolase
MTAASERARVVAEARRWIGTPYHPCADVRGHGVDCGMLIVRVFVDTGLVPAFDPRPYPPDWHLHHAEEKYLGFVSDRCRAIALGDVAPGDVLVFRYGRCHAHGGVVTGTKPLTLVHAFSPARAVIEEPVARNATLADPKRDPRAFSFWAGASTP